MVRTLLKELYPKGETQQRCRQCAIEVSNSINARIESVARVMGPEDANKENVLGKEGKLNVRLP
jgi:hypothetical protein